MRATIACALAICSGREQVRGACPRDSEVDSSHRAWSGCFDLSSEVLVVPAKLAPDEGLDHGRKQSRRVEVAVELHARAGALWLHRPASAALRAFGHLDREGAPRLELDDLDDLIPLTWPDLAAFAEPRAQPCRPFR